MPRHEISNQDGFSGLKTWNKYRYILPWTWGLLPENNPTPTGYSSGDVYRSTPGFTTLLLESTKIGTVGELATGGNSWMLCGVAGDGGVLLGVPGWLLGTSNKFDPLRSNGSSSFFCCCSCCCGCCCCCCGGVKGLLWLSCALSGDLTATILGLGASMFDSSFSDNDVTSLVSSSSAEPCACDWWYFKPLMCLYFLEQLGSGHSRRTGEGGGLVQGAAGGAVATTGTTGAREAFGFFTAPPGWGAVVSSSPARLFRLLVASGRGGTNGVGEEGAVEGPEPLAAAPPLRPLTPTPPPVPPPPLRSLLWTDDRVSKRNKHLDLKRAFETIDWQIILSKLKQYGIGSVDYLNGLVNI